MIALKIFRKVASKFPNLFSISGKYWEIETVVVSKFVESKPTKVLIRLQLLTTILILVMLLCPNNSAADTKIFTAAQIRTDAVDLGGKRRETSSIECINAPTEQLFEQASFQAYVVTHKDDDERSCTISFHDLEEYAPDILEPRTACLHSYVKSVGGTISKNKRGHLQCAMNYRARENEVFKLLNPSDASGSNAGAVVVGLPADIALEREQRSLITVSVPLRTLQFAIDHAIHDKRDMNLPAGFDLRIMSSGFRSYTIGSRNFHFYVDLDITGPVNARCEVDARFAIPAAHPEAVIIQDLGTTSNCRSGSLIGEWFNLSQELSNSIRETITKNLGNKLIGEKSPFSDWAKDDPELAAIIQKSLIQGRYCEWRTEPGLCIAIGWRHANTINDWEAILLTKTPKTEGSLDEISAHQKLEKFSKEAIVNHQAEVNGIRYPSGRFVDGKIEDGDMGIFGGLLCRSNVSEGCQLLRNANTSDGRFWRSPGRKGEPDTNKHASFSGDQLKGILHYFTTTGDKDRLERFLQYLKNMKTPVPDSSVEVESGYSSCPNFGPNFTCLLNGSDWYILKLLAKKYNLESELPNDLKNIELRYGFSYDTLVWEALMTRSGYPLHLVANTAWILRSLGEKDSRLDKIFKIIAARQPKNPFYLYLLLGPDLQVQRFSDNKCTLPVNRNDFSDWAWQRAESQHAWEHSMVWDCVFMYSLILNDPIPKK